MGVRIASGLVRGGRGISGPAAVCVRLLLKEVVVMFA